MSATPETISCAVGNACLTSIDCRPLYPPTKVIPIPIVRPIPSFLEKLRDRSARTSFALLIFDLMNPYTDQAIAPANAPLNFIFHPRPVGRFGAYQHRRNARPLKCRLDEAFQLRAPLLLSFFPDRGVSPASSRGSVHFTSVAYVGCSPHIKFIMEAEEYTTTWHDYCLTIVLDRRVVSTWRILSGNAETSVTY